MCDRNLQQSFATSSPFSHGDINQITAYYQPIVQFNGTVVGFETLARIITDQGTIQTPANFIHRIEPHNASFLDIHMLKQACAFLARCGKVNQLPVINVNFSPSTLAEDGIVERISECLQHRGVSSAHIGIEITEQPFGSDQQEILDNVKAISDVGHPISLDDYGAGHTNAERLRMLQGLLEKDVPLTVKLDMSIVKLQEWIKSFSSVLEDGLFKKVSLVFEGISLDGMGLVDSATTERPRVGRVNYQTFSLYEPMPEHAALEIVVQQNAPVVVRLNPAKITNPRLA